LPFVDALQGAFICLIQKLPKTLDETYERIVHQERIKHVEKGSGLRRSS